MNVTIVLCDVNPFVDLHFSSGISFHEWKYYFMKQKQPTVFCKNLRCSVKKGVPRNFAKHLCERLFFNKVTGLSLWHRCFPVNFARFLITPPDDYFWWNFGSLPKKVSIAILWFNNNCISIKPLARTLLRTPYNIWFKNNFLSLFTQTSAYFQVLKYYIKN